MGIITAKLIEGTLVPACLWTTSNAFFSVIEDLIAMVKCVVKREIRGDAQLRTFLVIDWDFSLFGEMH